MEEGGLHLGILQVTQPEKRIPYFVDPNTGNLLTESGRAQGRTIGDRDVGEQGVGH